MVHFLHQYPSPKNTMSKRIIEVIKPKLIKGPIIPVLINLKKLNLIFLVFSINKNDFSYGRVNQKTNQERLI